MSRGRPYGSSGQRLSRSAEERAAAEEDYRSAVERLRRSAFRNFRHALANLTIFFAIVSAMMIVAGGVTPATMIPMSVSVFGGTLGVCTYIVRGQPVVARRLLIAALILAALGLAGAILVGALIEP